MAVLVLILLFPLVTACSTIRPTPAPSAAAAEPSVAAVAEPSGADVSGRWRGHWTGTGLFDSSRQDDVTFDLVQRGDAGYGRLVFQGTTAAEAVPEVIRRAGQWGTRVFAQISPSTVTVRHQHDGRLFTADLKLAEDGEHLSGFVRGSHPKIGLVLTREPRKTAPETPVPAPAPQATNTTPPPVPAAPIAMVPPPPAPEPKVTEAPAERPNQEEFVAVQELPAVHFDFDKSELRADALDTLTTHAGWLKEHADAAVLIEGHCDERGTSEYNVSLGERRAISVRDYLSQQGVASERLSTISFGKERPACAVDNPDCHEMNRRTEFRVKSR